MQQCRCSSAGAAVPVQQCRCSSAGAAVPLQQCKPQQTVRHAAVHSPLSRLSKAEAATQALHKLHLMAQLRASNKNGAKAKKTNEFTLSVFPAAVAPLPPPSAQTPAVRICCAGTGKYPTGPVSSASLFRTAAGSTHSCCCTSTGRSLPSRRFHYGTRAGSTRSCCCASTGCSPPVGGWG